MGWKGKPGHLTIINQIMPRNTNFLWKHMGWDEHWEAEWNASREWTATIHLVSVKPTSFEPRTMQLNATQMGPMIQTIQHIINDCATRKFSGGLAELFQVTDRAIDWIKDLDILLWVIWLELPESELCRLNFEFSIFNFFFVEMKERRRKDEKNFKVVVET